MNLLYLCRCLMRTWIGCGTWRCCHGPESHTSCATRSDTCNIWITSSLSTNWMIQRCKICCLDCWPGSEGCWYRLHPVVLPQTFSVNALFGPFFVKLESTKGTYTLTSICIFTFVQCMFLWLVHRPSTVQVPPTVPRLYPDYEVTSTQQRYHVTNIIYCM